MNQSWMVKIFFEKAENVRKIGKAYSEIGGRTEIEELATEGKEQRGVGFRFEEDQWINK